MTATNLNVGSLGRKMSSPIAAQFSFILMFRTIQINLKTQQIKMLHRQKSEIEARFPQPCNLGATRIPGYPRWSIPSPHNGKDGEDAEGWAESLRKRTLEGDTKLKHYALIKTSQRGMCL
jgi:hypothetical protein